MENQGDTGVRERWQGDTDIYDSVKYLHKWGGKKIQRRKGGGSFDVFTCSFPL